METRTPHVVIVGGGFGGLSAARELARAPVRVTLLDRRNHHVFQPLLYQVATAGLSAPEIAAPIRRILARQRNVTVLLADVSSVDVEGRRVQTSSGEIPYDALIVATGATHSYFGRDDWAPHAPGLKTLEDALEIRRRVLLAFERAESEEDPGVRRAWLTFAVVGAGPTGVELAGTLAEIARHTLRHEFRRSDPGAARIVLLEGADRVLLSYPPDLAEKARRQLEHLGVDVRTGARVTAVSAQGLLIGDQHLPARTTLWAAGIAASPLGASLGAPLDRAGRVGVDAGLNVPGRSDVFVVGDLVSLEQEGRPIPGVAPAANQMGRHAARNALRGLRGEALLPFRYVDKGSLATIGRRAAVAVLGRFKLSGFLAWLAWLVVHIFFLIGFRNRFVVFVDWAWAYFTYQRHARLILGLPDASSAPRE